MDTETTRAIAMVAKLICTESLCPDGVPAASLLRVGWTWTGPFDWKTGIRSDVGPKSLRKLLVQDTQLWQARKVGSNGGSGIWHNLGICIDPVREVMRSFCCAST